jgi:hypothetical protein
MAAEADPQKPRADGPLEFHSSREERLALAGAPLGERDRRFGLFRRNRTLLIVFVDILLFLTLAVLLVRFLYSQTPRGRLEGCAVSLRGLVYGEVVYATLTVNRERSQAAPGDGRIHVRLALSPDAQDADVQFLSASLPEAGGPELVLRGTLTAGAGPRKARTLYAEVRIGESSRRLSFGLAP